MSLAALVGLVHLLAMNLNVLIPFLFVYGSVSEKQNRETRKESKKKRCVLFKPELVKDNGEEWSLMQTRL